MKTTIQVLSLLVFLISFQSAAAAVDPGATETNREADHAALRQLRDQVVIAINKLDGDALAPCFAKEFALTTVTQSVLTNPAQVAEFFERTFRAKDALISGMQTEPTADILTRFIDENTGVCYGSTKDSYTLKSGEVVTMHNRWSATVVKENGEWKVAMAHVGTDFLNNPLLDGAAAFAKKLAIGAGLGGLVVGMVLGHLMGGRKRARGKANA
ncbi:MAG: nuclear transport factor 2 family protein [Verrucomicrobia bacterium]|nr:nuclear transport factor 2 family protein [Verrucomicrobiota bacterium]